MNKVISKGIQHISGGSKLSKSHTNQSRHETTLGNQGLTSSSISRHLSMPIGSLAAMNLVNTQSQEASNLSSDRSDADAKTLTQLSKKMIELNESKPLSTPKTSLSLKKELGGRLSHNVSASEKETPLTGSPLNMISAQDGMAKETESLRSIATHQKNNISLAKENEEVAEEEKEQSTQKSSTTLSAKTLPITKSKADFKLKNSSPNKALINTSDTGNKEPNSKLKKAFHLPKIQRHNLMKLNDNRKKHLIQTTPEYAEDVDHSKPKESAFKAVITEPTIAPGIDKKAKVMMSSGSTYQSLLPDTLNSKKKGTGLGKEVGDSLSETKKQLADLSSALKTVINDSTKILKTIDSEAE